MAVSVPEQLEQARESGMGRDDLAGAALEDAAPLRGNGVGILEVLLEQILRIAGVQTVDVHWFRCSRGARAAGLTRADGS